MNLINYIQKEVLIMKIKYSRDALKFLSKLDKNQLNVFARRYTD